MQLNVFNYLIVIFIVVRYTVICRKHHNELYSDNKYTFEKRGNQPRKYEYVPLNSITLNQLYNKNKPEHVLDSNKRNRWIKQGNKLHKKNDNTLKSKNAGTGVSSQPLIGIRQKTSPIYTTTSEVFPMYFTLNNTSNYIIVLRNTIF